MQIINIYVKRPKKNMHQSKFRYIANKNKQYEKQNAFMKKLNLAVNMNKKANIIYCKLPD